MGSFLFTVQKKGTRMTRIKAGMKRIRE